MLNKIQARNGPMVSIWSCHYALDRSIEAEVHIKGPEIKVYWKKYRLVLVVPCDIEAAQYGKGMEFAEVLSNTTS